MHIYSTEDRGAVLAVLQKLWAAFDAKDIDRIIGLLAKKTEEQARGLQLSETQITSSIRHDLVHVLSDSLGLKALNPAAIKFTPAAGGRAVVASRTDARHVIEMVSGSYGLNPTLADLALAGGATEWTVIR